MNAPLSSLINDKVDRDKIADLFEKAVDLYNDLRDRTSAKVKDGRKAWYNDIRKDLLEGTDALYGQLSDLVKATAE